MVDSALTATVIIHVAASITTLSQLFNQIQTGEEEQD
jgi:hypothetical protein